MKTYKTAYDKIKEEIDRVIGEVDAYGYSKNYAWYATREEAHEAAERDVKERAKAKPKKKVVKKPNIKVVDNFIDWPQAA
jgi:hypothetical protein